MRRTTANAAPSPTGMNTRPGGQAAPDHLPAAVASSAAEDQDDSMAMFTQLATVPVWRATVAGAMAQAGVEHIGGGARVTINRPGLARPARRTGATVALADGTHITFGEVEEGSALELA